MSELSPQDLLLLEWERLRLSMERCAKAFRNLVAAICERK